MPTRAEHAPTPDEILDARAPAMLSLHSGDPGTTGAHELVGHPYARRPARWSPSRFEVKDLAESVVFGVPAGVEITHVGMFSDDGRFIGSSAVKPDGFGKFTTAGIYTLASLRLEIPGVTTRPTL